MLRVHFGDADLARTRLSSAPHPLWEIATSLHRLQTRQGRWAYAEWYRTIRQRLRDMGMEHALRTMLLPLFPRAAYFPDFLTPTHAADGLEAGLEGILATPRRRVLKEVAHLDRVVGAPSWAPRLGELSIRKELVGVLRAYYEAAIAPYEEVIHARIEAERAARCRGLMDGGVEGMLAGLRPTMRWERSVLHVEYHPAVDRDLRLNGRGVLLVPSYFNWQRPVTLADPALPPAMIYPLIHEPSAPPPGHPAGSPAVSLTALLGRARAVTLHTVAAGATTGEIARAAGVAASSASRHAGALRDAGLVTSVRHGATVLHTLTPTGASVLRAALTRSRGTP
ncbi:helix-turn-helix domain-containing protein [Streptomyces mutabilis]|uniref:helix-turn-helix domain-containing protein n=1 Tax=Streptomyces TaxID=1883 RepID=UPI0025B1B75E|nr:MULTISPECIES: helix-turn-helix domain-containing protein [unclassified Streptomyces]MDN3248474.1 helix-turn-helix domain-containing protein [Streptomyces sp. ZSW22]MDQ0385810.1 DNA-binding transcriptional ArsR family regulator [Streptomyces sp. DSM 42143]